MAIVNSVSAASALVAIDIASRRHHILIKPVDKKRYRLSITNDKVDHDRLVEHLRALGSNVVVAFEATGNYHRAIAWRMCGEGYDVRLVSSVALARTREALQNGWDKNDPRDAQVILHMLSNGLTQRYYDPLIEGINDWQELPEDSRRGIVDEDRDAPPTEDALLSTLLPRGRPVSTQLAL